MRLRSLHYHHCNVFLRSPIPMMLLTYSFLPGIDLQHCIPPLPRCFPVPPWILWGVPITLVNTGGIAAIPAAATTLLGVSGLQTSASHWATLSQTPIFPA